MKTTEKFVLALGLFAISFLAVGCGGGSKRPDLGTVSGTVTMDDKPLASAIVSFHSNAKGRPGTGLTDKEGHYELIYRGGVEGTQLGPAKIEITTEFPEGEVPDGESEPIPKRYNTNTELTADVKAGANVFDFKLTSEAE